MFLGIDYAHNRDLDLYFNALYEDLDAALKQQPTAIYFGQATSARAVRPSSSASAAASPAAHSSSVATASGVRWSKLSRLSPFPKSPPSPRGWRHHLPKLWHQCLSKSEECRRCRSHSSKVVFLRSV